MDIRDQLAGEIIRAGLPALVLDGPRAAGLRRMRGLIGSAGAIGLMALALPAMVTGSGWLLAAATAWGLVFGAWLTGMLRPALALGRHVLDGVGRAAGAAIVALAPMLVLLLFGFYTAEVWQVFGHMDAWRHTLIILLFATLILGTVWTTLRADRRALCTLLPPAELQRLAQDGPAAALATAPPPDAPALTNAARRNIATAFTAAIMIRVVTVAAAVAGALVLLGLITLEPATMDAWAGGSGLWPLIHVAATLGAFAGLAFAVVAGSDTAARAQLVGDESLRIRRALATWAYWRALAPDAPADGHDTSP